AGEDTELQNAATTALQRLETVLSPVTRDRIGALQRALAPGRRSDKAPVPVASQHVFALAEAIDKQRRIQISYRSPGGFPLSDAPDNERSTPVITLRQVDPYGL